MKHDGKLSISRVSSTQESYIQIELVDANAHITVVKVDIPIELFGAIVTGLSYQPVTFEAFNVDKIGKTMENKTEQIYVDCDIYDKSVLIPILKKALLEYEIGGWKAEMNSLNSQRSTGKDKDGKNYVNMHFRRWV